MNHPSAWCVPSIQLGCKTYTKAQAIAIMQQSTSTDVTYILAFELIGAKLDISCNKTNSSCISSSISAADAWLCQHPIGSGVSGSSAAWQQIAPTSETLDRYNDGHLCAPQCN